MALLTAVAVACSEAAASRVPYDPTWASLDTRPNPPWYEEARVGIKIHWGPYAVPSYGALGTYAEQYARFYRVGVEGCGTPANPVYAGCRTAAFHRRVWGNATYDSLFFSPASTPGGPGRRVAGFNPVLYNATEWASVFARSGARYVYMTAKHSDGFALWPSPRRSTTSVATIGRDLLGELMGAVKAAGMRKGIFYEMEDYFNFGCSYNVNASGVALHSVRCPWGGSDAGFPPGTAASYVATTLIPEITDLVNRYKPSYLYADGDWSGSDDFLRTKPFLAWLFNDSPVKDHVVVNDRWGNTTRTHHGGTYLCEYDPSCKFVGHAFAVTQGFGKSFGFNRREEVNVGEAKWCDWGLPDGGDACRGPVTLDDERRCCTHTNATGLIHLLVRTVAKGGNLEINVGPEGDGSLPPSQTMPLLAMGRWLGVNGEAVYNTTGLPFGPALPECTADEAGEGEGAVDKCYTASRGPSPNALHVIYLRWPRVAAVSPSGATGRVVHLDHVRVSNASHVAVTLLADPKLAITAGATPAGGLRFFVPDAAPDTLRCELDMCHAFAFRVTGVGWAGARPRA